MQNDRTVRRLEDGSVDFDAYKRSAARSRRAAKRKFARLLMRTLARWADRVAGRAAALGATIRERPLRPPQPAHLGNHCA
jgi:hypothetical protein